MRMHGLGRLAYNASDAPESPNAASLTLDLLRADWSTFKEGSHAQYLSPILEQIVAQSAYVKEGSMGNPGDFWQSAAKGLPNVSLNTIKKKTCTPCHEAAYYQTRQDIDRNSSELYGKASSKDTFPQALDPWFEDHAIDHHKNQFPVCTHCSPKLLSQKTVMLDRPPRVLCMGMNTGEKDSLPDLKDPNTVLDSVELKFEHIFGEERSVSYKTVALVYFSGPND